MSTFGATTVSGPMAILGWTLLHFLWEGAVVALLLWCVLALLEGRSSQTRYAVCCAALLLMVVLPAATFLRLGGLDALRGGGPAPVAAWVTEVQASFASGADRPWSVRLGEVLGAAAPVLPWMWLVGVFAGACRLALGLVAARRIRRAADGPAEAWVEEIFASVVAKLQVRRLVSLFESAQIEVPTMIGWLRPAVLLPVCCLSGLSRVQVEALLAHELAHIRRHDYLVSVLQGVVEALLFYHPAVWWVSQQVRRERECCCDAVAAACCGNRLEYARALSVLEGTRSAQSSVALGANGGVLTMRIKRVLGYRDDSVASQVSAVAVLSLVLVTAMAMLVREVRAENRAESASSGAVLVSAVLMHDTGLTLQPAAEKVLAAGGETQTADTKPGALPDPVHGAYRVWLNQDAVWIITPEETATFRSLTRDEERDSFISDFWLRRDAVGAPPNSYRAEHYRRIQYSNEHFASGTHVGWRTDRGHAYIAYGRPASVESHPSGGALANGRVLSDPFEVWHYGSVAGIGDNVNLTFVDTCRCGEYGVAQALAVGSPAGSTAETRAVGAASLFRLTSRGASRQASAGWASLGGVVVDPTGAVMPRVTVAAVNAQSGRREVQQTAENGGFAFSLPEGKYVLEAAAVGFKSSVAQISQLTVSEPIHLTIKLQVGGINESLKVRAGDGPQAQPNLPSNAGEAERVSAGLMAGNATSQVQPIYPPEAKANRVQGTVVLRAVISKTGEVRTLRVVSGPSELQDSAMNAVKQWRYRPYLLNGQPTEVETSIRVNYTFGGDGGPAVPAEPGASRQQGLPLRVSAGVMAGQAITQVAPTYPEDAKAGRVQGTVVLHAVVSKEGDIEDLQVISGPDQLRESALDAVKQWKYKPYLLNGEPVEIETTINVNYTLEE